MSLGASVKIVYLSSFLLFAFAAASEMFVNHFEGGYSQCDYRVVTEMHPSPEASFDRLIDNIEQLLSKYEGSLMWRGKYITAFLFTCMVCAINNKFNDPNYFLTLLLLSYLFLLQAMSFQVHHTFKPLAKIITGNCNMLRRKLHNDMNTY